MQRKGTRVTFKCKTKEECDLKKAEFDNKEINKTLKKGKGVCENYAKLFERMCNIAGINCYYVSGYTKSEAFQIGKMGYLNHAWNVVVLDGIYYYFDPTWTAGGCTRNEDGELDKFHKKYNDYYWMTPIDKLSRNHYPKDTTWIKNAVYLKELFKNNPFIDNSIIAKIEILTPKTGVIEAKLGDTLNFVFRYKNEMDKIQINTNSRRNPSVWYKTKTDYIVNEKVLSKQQYVDYTRDDDNIRFNYVIKEKPISYLEILFDYRLVIKYKIKISN
ncbi:transglutaminase superfamily protein [Flavobacterium aciduliphilum]|uniref:Transglutaminase superfamily protein n=2 Tax=Flavobacterium aciduliphilum TaxID=1101402 RepID=A0A328YHM6_9FLAO|nr:transglutaminase superfamily protein [Flavobacterium aciduliphilum]